MATSTNIPNSQMSTALDKRIPVTAKPESVSLLVDHFTNADSTPLTVAQLATLTLQDYMAAFQQFKSQLTASIGTGVNADLKVEIQEQIKSQQFDTAKSSYGQAI